MIKANLSIRSITIKVDFYKITENKSFQLLLKKINFINKHLKKKKIKITTFRICFNEIDAQNKINFFLILNKFREINELLKINKNIIRWYSIPINVINCNEKQSNTICDFAYEILKKYESSFVNLIVSNEKKINGHAVMNCANLIKRVSFLSANSYDNFRLGITCNQTKGTPFFPFTNLDKFDSISVALETANFFNVLTKKNNIDDFEQNFNKLFVPSLRRIENEIKTISKKLNFQFNGFDCSIAPYPEKRISVVPILKNLGLEDFGSNGTAYLTFRLTKLLKSIEKNHKIKCTGFNGVMYSVLEDYILCELANKKTYTINDLLLYSNFCGVGIDMVPLPGHILLEEIASMLIDLATIASKNKKQLGFRILPIQNGMAGDLTSFDTEFITNCRIFDIKNSTLKHGFFNKKIYL